MRNTDDFIVAAARQEGKNIAWVCAREALLKMSNMEVRDCFKVDRWQDIFLMSGEEAVYKFQKWVKENG